MLSKRECVQQLFKIDNIKMPSVLPHRDVRGIMLPWRGFSLGTTTQRATVAWVSSRNDHAASSEDCLRGLAPVESGVAAARVSTRTDHAASSEDTPLSMGARLL